MSQTVTARVAGAFYLLTTAAGLFYAFAGPSTVAGIAANEQFYRINILANLVAAAAYLVVTCLLYRMFRPVDETLSLVAASFSLIGIASAVLSFACDAAPLYLIQAGSGTASADLWMHLSGVVQNAALLFFGVYCLLIGNLIYRSRFVPKLIGFLMGIAGACYLVHSCAVVLAPRLGQAISFITFGALIGEAALTLWLLFGRPSSVHVKD